MGHRNFIGRRSRGFTLIELMIVVAIISLIAGIAIPQLAPVIAYSSNEGAARRLAGYGQSAISRAQLMHENLTVMVDLRNQEYWTMVQPDPPLPGSELEGFGEGEGEAGRPMDSLELLSLARTARDPDVEPDEDDLKRMRQEADRMTLQFDWLARKTITARAVRVIHDAGGILEDVGPQFEKFSFDGDQVELEPEEIGDPLLPRTRLPDGIVIDRIRVGEKMFTRGTVEIVLGPVGLENDVRFLLVGEDGDIFAVQWDPIIGTGRLTDPENFE